MFSGAGNSTPGESLVSAAREAREERAASRRRETAAIKIQTAVRGFVSRRKYFKLIRNEFDEVFKQFENATSSNASLPDPIVAFKKAYLLIKNYKKDVDAIRLHSYARYIVTSLSSPTFQLRCIACVLNQQNSVIWIKHMKEMLELSLKFIQNLSADTSSESRLLSLHLHLSLMMTSSVAWPGIPAPLQAPMSKLTESFLSHLVENGLYSSLKHALLKGLCRSIVVLKGPALGTIITLVLRPLKGENDGLISNVPDNQASQVKSSQEKNLLFQFLLNIMSIPAVISHLDTMVPESFNHLSKKNVVSQCLYYLADEQRLSFIFQKLEASYSLCLLANLIQLMNMYITKHKKNESSNETESSKSVFDDEVLKFGIIVHKLQMKIGEFVNSKQKKSGSSCTKNATASQWHPILGWFAHTLDQNVLESLSFVREQLHLLWCETILNTLFSSLPSLIPTQEQSPKSDFDKKFSLAEQAVTSSRPWSIRRIFEKKLSLGLSSISGGTEYNHDITEIRKVAYICSLYYIAMNTFSQLKMDILTGLCYKSPVVVQLWCLLQTPGHKFGFKYFLDRLSQNSKPGKSEQHMLILFCDSTAHLVSVVDDLELYDQQKPFTLAEYTLMTKYLNTMCFKLIHHGLVDSRDVWSCPLFTSIHSLLTLLIRRNSRRKLLLSDSALLISDLKLSAFKDRLMSGNIVEQTILQTLPHIVPHDERVLLFRANVSAQKASLAAVTAPHPFTIITVFRSSIVEDGYRQLNSLPANELKGVIRVRFVNEQGLDEAGIDQDGVFKEFLEETLKKVLDPSLNLFKLNGENQLYPSSSSSLTDNHLELLEFTGKMLGKALYEGIVVDCPFAGFFLSQVIGEQQSALYSSIDQLPSLDPELYKNLTYIKHYEGNVEDLGLTFSYDEERMGEVISHDLRPSGKLIPVTSDNRIIYIHLMAHFKMHMQIRDQTKAFVKGFRSIINPDWLAMFSIPELQRIISGDNAPIDLKDLRKNTQYYGGFHDSHRVVCWLWDILEKDLTPQEHSLFLKFVTSCSKPPLLGFQHLEPCFSIRCVEVGDDEDTGDTVGSVVRGFLTVGRKDPVHRLPTASTCFNLLKLPNYQKKSTLRTKLKYAINSNTGFELS